MTDQALAAEVVKLKQKVAELRNDLLFLTGGTDALGRRIIKLEALHQTDLDIAVAASLRGGAMTDIEEAVNSLVLQHEHPRLDSRIARLKQEVAELHAAIERIDAAAGDMLKDHDGNYSPTLKPLDDGWGHAEDGWPFAFDVSDPACICEQERRRLRYSTTAGWHCPVHGNCAERVSW